MKNTEIKAHRVGSKAYQKELFRLMEEFDGLARKVMSGKGTSEEFDRMLQIAESEYGAPLYEIIVGECYLYGICTKPNRMIAEEWFQKAKKHGNDLACLRLSYIYASLEDEEESISCLRRAKWHGSKLAAGMLKEMEKHPFEREIPKA